MELTISEIKEKQKILKLEITKLLNDFHNETGVTVYGEVNYGYVNETNQQFISLEFANPFQYC